MSTAQWFGLILTLSLLSSCHQRKETSNDLYYGIGPRTHGDVVEVDMVKPETD